MFGNMRIIPSRIPIFTTCRLLTAAKHTISAVGCLQMCVFVCVLIWCLLMVLMVDRTAVLVSVWAGGLLEEFPVKIKTGSKGLRWRFI